MAVRLPAGRPKSKAGQKSRLAFFVTGKETATSDYLTLDNLEFRTDKTIPFQLGF